MSRLATLLALCTLVAPACDATPGTRADSSPPADAGATVPQTQALPVYTARQFFETLAVRGASFSHDGQRLLITSDATGIPNVYVQPVAGGEPTALTRSRTDNTYAISFFPEDDRALYTADQGGNELHHLYVVEPDGKSKDLTPGDRLKAQFSGWSADHRSFWVSTNERDPRFFDLYAYDAETYQRTLVFKNDEAWSIQAVDPMGKYVALHRQNDNADSDVYLFELGKKRAKPGLLTKHEGKAQHQAFSFSRDGKRLYYGTDAHSEFQQAWSYDLASKKHQVEYAAEWDVRSLGFSDSGRYRVAHVNADARDRVQILDTKSGQELGFPAAGDDSVHDVTFSWQEDQLAYYAGMSNGSTNLYTWDLSGKEPRRLTDTLNPALDASQLVEAQTVRFASYDGVEIPCVLWRPREASARTRVPAMLWIHGGPGGQTRTGFRGDLQHLVNHGYAVLAVNNRGSSGYGKTFHHMDDHKHGEADLDDVVAAKKYLQGLDWVDPDRIGIMGGSYGGYMTLAALAFRPQEFAVGVDIFGVANWIRTLESIPPWWESFRNSLYTELGNPQTDRERLERVSPLLHADQIERPLLVIQGANDPRVLKVESDEIVEAVKKKGVPVEYVVFDDEGHGFRKRENKIRAAEATLKFLDTHLRGG